MSDKEDSTASLGHSEKPSVKYSPREIRIPDVFHFVEQLPECVIFRVQASWNILPKKPARPKTVNSSDVFKHETRLAIKAFPSSGDAERLAGASSHNDIWPSITPDKSTPIDLGYVSDIGYVRPPRRKHRAWKLVNLAECHWLPSERFPCERGCFDTREQAYVPHTAILVCVGFAFL